MQGDTPIHRKTFLEMNELEQIEFIKELRDRRLSPINIYNEVKQALQAKKQEQLNKKFEKEVASFEKCLEKVNKYLDELQSKANKLRIIKIQLDIQ